MRTFRTSRLRGPPCRSTADVVAELRQGLHRAADDLTAFERRQDAGAAHALQRQLEGLRRSARDLQPRQGGSDG